MADYTPSKLEFATEELQLLLQLLHASQLSMPKRERFSFDKKQKRMIFTVIQKCEHNCSKAHTVLTQSGVKVGYRTLCRIYDVIQNSKLGRTVGKPIDGEFELAVMTKVFGQIFYELPSQDGSIVHMRPLQAIIEAGIEISQKEPFRYRQRVKSLKFSYCWAAGVLRRYPFCNLLLTRSQTNERVLEPPELGSIRDHYCSKRESLNGLGIWADDVVANAQSETRAEPSLCETIFSLSR